MEEALDLSFDRLLMMMMIYIYIYTVYNSCILERCQSPWPLGLRRGSAAIRFLELWVRIPPGRGCLSVVSVMCCQVAFSVRG